jgi:uncharacterized membrane protein YeiB
MTTTRPPAPTATGQGVRTPDDTAAIPHDCEPATVARTRPAAGAAGRLVGVDVARGLALVGMMAVHILPPEGRDGGMSTVWILSSGKSAALFAVLAGVGIAFSSGGRRRPSGRNRDAAAAALLVRALLIGIVGLLLGYAVSADTADIILTYYAVLFVLAVPLLSLSTRALVALAAAVTLVVPVLSHVVRAGLPGYVEANPTVTDVLTRPLQLTTELTLTGVFPAATWMGYLCVGIAVGRSMLGSRGVVIRFGLLGIAVALAASAGSWLVMTAGGGWSRLSTSALTTMSPAEFADLAVWGFAGTTPTTSPWWLGVMAPHSSTPFDLAFTIGTSLGVLSAAVLLGRVAARLLAPLAAAGSMTLTLYSAHLLLTASPLQPGSAVVAFAAQLVLLVGFALLWGRWFGRGPLETAVWWATRNVRRAVMRIPARGHTTPRGGRSGPAASHGRAV